ncbi:glycoside hydrolase family 88 protein [Tropicimonas sp. TH_r6]|uniref:polygalacturonase PglA n=1 Tax=Tropicimonas sp. TH_r6 TaxID=3082085 RepID=UPI002953C309|nr:glycoside hydrolase family 88 protein [Tropicimonas sp. TH_r6]MDV7144845.1 glycoside hydrolase family 88 protein [Tropicimonas sp. TH_r6]
MSENPDLRVGALTPRTAVVLLAGHDIRFRLPDPVGWRLAGPSGDVSGTANTVAVFLDDLSPQTEYSLHANGSEIRFRTPACAGLVDAADFGLKADSLDNSAAFACAISQVPDRGTLLIPDGCWQTGPLFLKPRMTLHLSAGTRLLGSPDRNRYPILPKCDHKGRMTGTWEGLPASCYSSLITLIDSPDVAITGSGILDGGADAADWWHDHKVMRGAWRPRTVFALRSDRMSLSGLSIRNSPSWTIHPVNCDHTRVAGISVWNPSDSPNTDGLNPEMCRDVVIEGTFFSVGDDCIAIKAGKRTDEGGADHLAPSRRILVRNCRMERGHGGVVIGSEMSGSITRVRVENCEFDRTDRGLRIKTRRGRGGQVSNIALADCTMEEVDTAFSANAHYFCDHDGHSDAVQNRAPAPVGELTPRVEGIDVSRVRIGNTRIAVGAFLGLSEAPINGVSLREIDYSFDPEATAGIPLMADMVPSMRHRDLWQENADVRWEGHANGAAQVRPNAHGGLLAYFDAYAGKYSPYKLGNWCYEDGLVYLGLIALHKATGDSRWFAHLRRLADARIGPDGTLDGHKISDYNIDNILAGRALFHLFDEVGDRRYADAAARLIRQLDNHPRTECGNYWHKLRYPWQVWLDGLYMGLPFQLEYGVRQDRTSLVEDAVAQLRTALRRMYKPATGLHAHAWDEACEQPWADPVTGFNADHWARANGWLAMALVDICGLLGAEQAATTGLGQSTREMLCRVVEMQTEAGLWLQVPDRPDLAGNWEEVSASAMFAYALLKADRLGLAPERGGMAGRAGFDALGAVIEASDRSSEGAGFGPMCHVAGLGSFQDRYRDGTAEYYISETRCDDDPKGVGPMMMATAEILRLDT